MASGLVENRTGIVEANLSSPSGVTAPNPLPTPPCNADAPYPVGKDTVCGCKKWYTIQRGDDCGPVAARFGISSEQLIKWNPWLSADVEGTHYPCMNMWPTDNLCVGTLRSILTCETGSKTN